MLSVEEIKNFIQDDASSDKKRFARKGQAYYEGDHDIKQYRLFYYNADGNLVEDKTRIGGSGGAVHAFRERWLCEIG